MARKTAKTGPRKAGRAKASGRKKAAPSAATSNTTGGGRTGGKKHKAAPPRKTGSSPRGRAGALRTIAGRAAAKAGVLKAAGDATDVSVTIDGPRNSQAAVAGTSIELSGESTRSGKGKVVLTPPTIPVDLDLKGQVGTATTFTIEINSKSKKKDFVLTQEHERKQFDFAFSDFGL
jgi:hypothetical protein